MSKGSDIPLSSALTPQSPCRAPRCRGCIWSGATMARPKTGYQLADGTKVPGTTTVTGRFKESGALIGWAYKRGLAGVPLYESRDDAADKGTNIHELVEMKIKGADDDAIQAQVRSDQALEGYMSFVKWYEGTKIKVVETETPLVSERY